MPVDAGSPLNGGKAQKATDDQNGYTVVALPSGRCLKDNELDPIINMFLFLMDKHVRSRLGLRDLLEELERSIIARVLSEFNGHQARAARFLQLRPTTLHEKLKKHFIDVEIKKTVHFRGVRSSNNGLSRKRSRIASDANLINSV